MEDKDEHHPVIEISSLPDVSKAEMEYLDTPFFQLNGTSLPRLPTPAQILQRYPNHREGGVFKFESSNLAVKIGHISCVKLEEAQAMIAIRQAFPKNGEVPVPEVFGWRRHSDTIYIYMSLVSGKTLGKAWPSLTKPEKVSICNKLSQIVKSLRHVSTTCRFIGMLNFGAIFISNYSASS